MSNPSLTDKALIESEMKCPDCDKHFTTANQVRMHYMRLHTNAGQKGAARGSKNSARKREEQLAKRRAYNKAWRARKKQTGDYDHWKRSAYEKTRDSYYAQGLTAHGLPFKGTRQSINAQQSEAFQRAQGMPSGNRKLRYVYPLPDQPRVEQLKDYAPSPRFCPTCGEDLTKWTKQI